MTPSDDTPLVSVIIPACNVEPYIGETVRSALDQSYPHLEVIVADDGSADGTLKVLRDLASKDPRLRIIEGEHCGHPGTVRNRAIKHARGRFLAFLDADDLWIHAKIERQLALFEQHPEVSLCFSPVLLLAEGQPVPPLDHTPPRSEASPLFTCPESQGDRGFESLLVRKRSIHTSSVMVRRSLADEIGPFSEDPALLRHQNNDYIFRAYRQGVPQALEDISAIIRRRRGSATSTSSWEHLFALLDAVDRRERLPARIRRRAWSAAWIVRAERALRGMNGGEPWRGPMFEAWRRDPFNPRRLPALIAILLPRARARAFYETTRRRGSSVSG